MKYFMGLGVAAIVLSGGVAVAQSATDTTTTQVVQAPVAPMAAAPAVTPPPPGTLESERTTRAVDAYGNQVVSKQTSYRDPRGIAQDTQTTTTTAPPPPPPPVTTTTTTESTTTDPR